MASPGPPLDPRDLILAVLGPPGTPFCDNFGSLTLRPAEFLLNLGRSWKQGSRARPVVALPLREHSEVLLVRRLVDREPEEGQRGERQEQEGPGAPRILDGRLPGDGRAR